MLNLIIDVEDTSVETKTKKDQSGTYQTQTAYAHFHDRNGQPERYPSKITVFVPKDNQSNPIPYKVGKYTVSPQSYRIGNGGFLELGFLNLIPVGK
jgi:hypothetical protein